METCQLRVERDVFVRVHSLAKRAVAGTVILRPFFIRGSALIAPTNGGYISLLLDDVDSSRARTTRSNV
jgi:hypothetical protein